MGREWDAGGWGEVGDHEFGCGHGTCEMPIRHPGREAEIQGSSSGDCQGN